MDPTADKKEKIDAAKGIYYNGVPLIKQKADYFKTSSFKGAYLWTLDYDATSTGKSLAETIYNSLK
ncbi:MAG: hypothetical protein ABIN94_01495 [Ferruginibacter sp.]